MLSAGEKHERNTFADMTAVFPEDTQSSTLPGFGRLAQLPEVPGLSLEQLLHEVDAFNARAFSVLHNSCVNQRHAKAILLKLSNLAVAKFHYLRRHARLISRPFGALVDPSNHCPLACPGCIQRKKNTPVPNIDWIPGMLKEPIFRSMLEAYGPWMTVLSLYNWGEPLLNAKTPQFIKEARRYLLRTSISSNLSVRFDLEALLNSGLDYLLVSIDGATQSTYEKYRVGGDLSLVLSNLEKLTAHRASMTNCNTFIVWRFLVFEHNRHEIEEVESLARSSGVDMLMFAEPYDVSHIDPTISKPAESLSRNIVFHPPGKRARQSLAAAGQDLDDHIDEVWDHGWASRYQGEEPDQSQAKTCQWLYANVAMDATGRIMPCCYDPVKDPTTIFGHINAGESVFNSREFTGTRTYFSDRANTPPPGTACPRCPYQLSSPHINARQAGLYFGMADSGGVLDSDSVNLLATW